MLTCNPSLLLLIQCRANHEQNRTKVEICEADLAIFCYKVAKVANVLECVGSKRINR